MTDTNTDPNYQDILNKYAQDLKEPEPEIPTAPEITPEPTPVAPTETQPEVTPEPEPATPELPPEPTSTATPDSTPAPEPLPQPESPPPSLPPTPPVDALPLTGTPVATETSDNPPPKENNFFKYLFFFSLIVFLVVLFFVVRSFLQGQQSTGRPLEEEKVVPTSSVTETPTDSSHCTFGEYSYYLGQTIQADDGCNTCTCEDSGELVCTSNTCSATDSAQNNQIDVATTSSSIN